MSDDRSGVFLVRDIQHKVIALWSGVYQSRPRAEQLAEIGDRFPAEDFLEKDSHSRARIERTPRGLPVVLQRRGPRLFTRKKLQEFEMEQQVSCYPVPRGVLESLAESEHGRSWLQLSDKEKLALLDCIVGLYRGN